MWLNMNNNVFSSAEVEGLQFMIFSDSVMFSVNLLGEGQTKCNVHDSYPFLPVVACYREPAQSPVTGLTDAPPGMLADRNCLEKGGASPKCNTKVLSCCCRTSATVVHVNIVRCLR